MKKKRQKARSSFSGTKFAALMSLALITLMGAGTVGNYAVCSAEGEVTSNGRGNLDERFATPEPIVVNDVSYVEKDNLTTFLLMGIDNGPKAERVGYSNGGRADFLLLLVADEDTKTVRQLELDRDTMAEITVLGVFGNEVGTSNMQICLAHSFGADGKQNCEYQVRAVEDLLNNITIDHYVSLDIASIGALNDALGGITVTLDEDFTAYDPTMTLGTTLTLNAEQAEAYVRGRRLVGDGTNVNRMKHQRVFLHEAATIAQQKLTKSSSFAETLYDSVKDIMVSDMNKGRMINELWAVKDYELLPLETLAGEHSVGQLGFVEFQVDTDDLMDWVIDVYYDPAS